MTWPNLRLLTRETLSTTLTQPKKGLNEWATCSYDLNNRVSRETIVILWGYVSSFCDVNHNPCLSRSSKHRECSVHSSTLATVRWHITRRRCCDVICWADHSLTSDVTKAERASDQLYRDDWSLVWSALVTSQRSHGEVNWQIRHLNEFCEFLKQFNDCRKNQRNRLSEKETSLGYDWRTINMSSTFRSAGQTWFR